MRLISCSLFLITGVTASCGTQPAGNHLDALPSGASITKCDKKYTKCTYTCDGNYELYDSKNEKKLSKSQLFCKKDIWKTSSALLCREKEVPSCHQPELIFSDKYLKHKKTWMLVENGADQFSIFNFQIHTGTFGKIFKNLNFKNSGWTLVLELKKNLIFDQNGMKITSINNNFASLSKTGKFLSVTSLPGNRVFNSQNMINSGKNSYGVLIKFENLGVGQVELKSARMYWGWFLKIWPF